ncbi:MAG: hypothetical protein L0Z62_16540 [Gemmataceae bacterium]|nr:hypothetical protein [Gemmataceae bacterium]
MSRKHTCARRRARQEAALREEAEAARERGSEAFWAFLTHRARSDKRVWDVARVIACDDDELAMIMQAIDRRRAGTTPGAVLYRHESAEHKTGKPYKEPQTAPAVQAPRTARRNINACR